MHIIAYPTHITIFYYTKYELKRTTTITLLFSSRLLKQTGIDIERSRVRYRSCLSIPVDFSQRKELQTLQLISTNRAACTFFQLFLM